MKFNLKKVILVLAIFVFQGILSCLSPHIFMKQNKSNFAPLPEDTPVFFYQNHTYSVPGKVKFREYKNALILWKVYKTGKQVAGLPNDYLNKMTGGTNDKFHEKKDEILRKIFDAYMKNTVRDISYFWIEKDMTLRDRYHVITQGEMRYPDDDMNRLDHVSVYAKLISSSVKIEDLPKIAHESLRRGANAVILESSNSWNKLDSDGNKVMRKKFTGEKKVEYFKHGNYYDYPIGGYTHSKTTEKYFNVQVDLGWKVSFSLIRFDGLVSPVSR